LKLSPLPIPRPPEITILAAVNSGRSDFANSSPTNLEVAASVAEPTASTAAEPPVAATASKPVERTVITLIASKA